MEGGVWTDVCFLCFFLFYFIFFSEEGVCFSVSLFVCLSYARVLTVEMLSVPKNMKLLAVPLFELYDNTARYGPQLSVNSPSPLKFLKSVKLFPPQENRNLKFILLIFSLSCILCLHDYCILLLHLLVDVLTPSYTTSLSHPLLRPLYPILLHDVLIIL